MSCSVFLRRNKGIERKAGLSSEVVETLHYLYCLDNVADFRLRPLFLIPKELWNIEGASMRRRNRGK
jgi:hypothetical protein